MEVDHITISKMQLTRKNIVKFFRAANNGEYKDCPIGKAFMVSFYEAHEQACPLYYEEDRTKCWNAILDIHSTLPRYETVMEALVGTDLAQQMRP